MMWIDIFLSIAKCREITIEISRLIHIHSTHSPQPLQFLTIGIIQPSGCDISQDKEYARRNNNHFGIRRGIYGDRNHSQKECRKLGCNKPSALLLAVAYLPSHFLRFLFVLAIDSALLFPKLFQYSISVHCDQIKYKVI